MKKLLFGVLLLMIGLVAWRSIRQPLAVNAAEPKPELVVVGDCAINFTVFDTKQYDPQAVDSILFDNKLIANKGEFITIVDKSQLPFTTINAEEALVNKAIDTIINNVCGGKCDENFLAMKSTCVDQADSSAISSIQTTYLERIANMSLCQKDIFDLMQINNNKYLEIIKKNNSAYYSTMAPITNAFRRDYFATNDKGIRQTILGAYRSQNSQIRKDLYQNQAVALSLFTIDVNKLNKSFAECK
jgi:hypothetical protein